jgi:hypothetical protein
VIIYWNKNESKVQKYKLNENENKILEIIKNKFIFICLKKINFNS